MKHIKLSRLCLATTIAMTIAMTMPNTLANPASERRAASAQPTAEDVAEKLKKHSQGALRLAGDQDELSADVQDLIDEQTDSEMIELLREIEVIMADATDLLDQKETGGPTIATETEVIEKIFEAAKKKKQKRKEGGG